MSRPDHLLDAPSGNFIAKYSDHFATRYLNPLFNRYWYRLTDRFFGDEDKVFLNWGYEEDPPMALPLAESDEPNRCFIQLYHRTATQVDLTGKDLLEVSCGHGGGASYLMRTQGPASYTGLDLNPVGLDFCRRKHQLPNLDFIEGSADQLPFADQSFDAVINIEASHSYPDLSRFLGEVARVLRPGGHFLYADVRRRQDTAAWEKELADSALRLVSEREINAEVARGIEKAYPALLFKMQPRLWALFNFTIFSNIYRALRSDQVSYRIYCFGKE